MIGSYASVYAHAPATPATTISTSHQTTAMAIAFRGKTCMIIRNAVGVVFVHRHDTSTLDCRRPHAPATRDATSSNGMTARTATIRLTSIVSTVGGCLV